MLRNLYINNVLPVFSDSADQQTRPWAKFYLNTFNFTYTKNVFQFYWPLLIFYFLFLNLYNIRSRIVGFYNKTLHKLISKVT